MSDDFSCACGFWASGAILDNKAMMDYAVKLHAEDHMRWRMAYTSAIFSGNQE